MKPHRIVVKLSLAFGGLMLILVGTGWLGLARMTNMRSELNTITTKRWELADLSREAVRCSSENNRITMLVFLIQDADRIKVLLEQRERNTARISELLNQISATARDTKEHELLREVRDRRSPYVEQYQQALQLLREGKVDEGRQMMATDVLPLLTSYHRAWERFVLLQGDEMTAASELVEASFLSARKQVLGLLALGVILGGSIAVFVARALLREIEVQRRAEDLQHARDELEKRVAERTSELSKANAELQATAASLSSAHKDLKASESRFRTLSESAPLGVFLSDGNGTILYSNPYCQRLTGVMAEAGTVGDWMQRIHPSDLPHVTAALERSRREGTDGSCEYRFVHPEGRVTWVHSRASVLKDDRGEIVGRIGTLHDITDQKQAETELERVHKDLLKASHDAGIAELANGVLHNVKNVVNSINVSASVIGEHVQKSESSGLTKVVALLREHDADLGRFIAEDPKGKLVLTYLEKLAENQTTEREWILSELRHFQNNVQHIKEIVSVQQGYAKRGGTTESASPIDLMEDSLRFNSSALARHGVQVVREYDADLPHVTVEKHKVLQILVNFIRNAKHACQESGRLDRKLILRVARKNGFICLAVSDNGIGISGETLNRLFEYGFTTKKDGHGFGLHSGVIAARAMGGTIEAHSDGPGTGATFTLNLPVSG